MSDDVYPLGPEMYLEDHGYFIVIDGEIEKRRISELIEWLQQKISD